MAVIAAGGEAGRGVWRPLQPGIPHPLFLLSGHSTTRASLPHAFLRNGWYTENYTGQLPQYLKHGAILGAAGEGQISAAPRVDYATVAAAVLTGEGHEGAVYELGGDEAFTMAELAAEVTEQAGTTVVYRDMPVEEYQNALVGFGMPDSAAAVYADADAAVARGDLFIDSGDLHCLIGRPTTPLTDVVANALPA